MPPVPERIAFWRRTPPAVFPPILGLFGLGLAWQRGEAALGLEPMLGQLILGAVTLLWLFAALCYLAKALRRPGVIVEDLRVLPGRAGLAAMTLSSLALATALVPVAPGAATVVLFAGLAAHSVLALMTIYVLASGPGEQRQVTPAWHLAFVGFILATGAATPLGYTTLSLVVLISTGAAAAIIYAVSLAQLARRDPPPPLRPLLAVHLAPPSLFGATALGLEMPRLALAFAVLALAILAALLVRARYLTASGFTPLWGAFTFPLAAFAGLMLALGGAGQGTWALAIGAVALAAATVIVPGIAIRVLQGWAKGALAAQTNAAVA